MGKKKGKGGRKKKKVLRDPNALTEVEKTFYELTISDIKRKTERLQNLIQDYEEQNEQLEGEIKEATENHNEETTVLKNSIKQIETEIISVKTAMLELEEKREDDTKEYTAIIESMEEQYEQTRISLQADVRRLAGKLNTLKEFKASKFELIQKYEDNQKYMEDQELLHKRRLYKNLKKFRIAKDLLKRDMEAKLVDLSTEFQSFSNNAMAPSMHRMIRENIAINNELNIIIQDHSQMCKTVKSKSDVLQKLRASENNIKETLGNIFASSNLLNKISSEYSVLQKDLEFRSNKLTKASSVGKELSLTNELIRSSSRDLNTLEQLLHGIICSKSVFAAERDNYKETALELTRMLTLIQITGKATLKLESSLVFKNDMNRAIVMLDKIKETTPKTFVLIESSKVVEAEQQMGSSFMELLRLQGIDYQELLKSFEVGERDEIVIQQDDSNAVCLEGIETEADDLGEETFFVNLLESITSLCQESDFGVGNLEDT